MKFIYKIEGVSNDDWIAYTLGAFMALPWIAFFIAIPIALVALIIKFITWIF
jgi:hypothetical protein